MPSRLVSYNTLFFCSVFLFLLSSIFLSSAVVASEITALITKDDSGAWSVKFSSTEEIKSLAFKRNPDQSRIERWEPVSDDFIIQIKNGFETVTRSDDQYFSEVAFELTPTYTPLPKEYAPFSPFTDGSMLFHSGRFFSCAESCSDSLNQWRIRVKATKDDNVIVNGKIHRAEASWLDSDSGKKIYIGKGKPIQDENFVSLIDESLPEKLESLMVTHLPVITSYFSEEMGRLDYRPSLYASFSQTSDGTYGNQGGILPGQIFMHWYGAKAIENLDEDSTLWFFAHEVAHLYQGRAGYIEKQADAWLHEGAAELFAGLAFVKMSGDKRELQHRLDKAQVSCLRAFKRGSNYKELALKSPKVHYSCGLLLWNEINNVLEEKGSNAFELWREFENAIINGKKASAATFVDVIKPHITEDLWFAISKFVSEQTFDSSSFFEELR